MYLLGGSSRRFVSAVRLGGVGSWRRPSLSSTPNSVGGYDINSRVIVNGINSQGVGVPLVFPASCSALPSSAYPYPKPC